MDLDTASIRDIRGIMINLNVPSVGCVTRDDLKAKLVENVPELRRAVEEKRTDSGVNQHSKPFGLMIDIPCIVMEFLEVEPSSSLLSSQGQGMNPLGWSAK